VLNGVDPMLQRWSVAAMLLGLLAVGALWDIRGRRIPNLLLLRLAGVGLGASVWLRPLPTALLVSVGGFVVGGVVWVVPYPPRMAGAADLKLAAAVGI
jgi:Flp pilus assembly protein protease CpaA